MPRLIRLELIGAAFMIALGSALHFLFGWSGNWPPVALIAAVNESIWEHLKIAFWPGVVWALLAPYPKAIRGWPLFAAKGVGLMVCATTIVLVFQSYTTILGKNLLALDIGTFAFSILVGQLISAWLLARQPRLLPLGIPVLVLLFLAFSLLTYAPPDHWLFTDARTGTQGIPVR